MPSVFAKIVTYNKTQNPLAFEWLIYRHDMSKFKNILSTVPHGQMILDIGCGSAKYWSLRPDLNWLGIDVNSESKAEIIIKPNENYPIEDNSVDAVLLSFSIEHISNLTHLLSELNRVLRNNGLIIIRCPFMYPLHDTPDDYWRFSIEGLDKLFSNFSKVSARVSGNYFRGAAVNRNYFLLQFYENFLNGRFRKALRYIFFAPFIFLILWTNLFSFALSRLDKTGKFPIFVDVTYSKS